MLLIALQIGLPSRTALPADSGLAPRRARTLAVPGLDPYPAIVQRDAFSPDRAGGGGEDGAGAALETRQVLGVILTPHGAAALIKTPGAAVLMAHVGQDVAGWRLAHIERDSVTFARGGQHRRLEVGAAPLAASSPAPAPQGAETPQ